MSSSIGGDNETVGERAKKKRRFEKKTTRDEREAFSKENRSYAAKERETRRRMKKLELGEETKLDVYGIGIEHPSRSPACGIVFQEGDDHGKDCIVDYKPGTLMGPPLAVPNEYPIHSPREPNFRRQQGDPRERLVDLVYMKLVRRYIRLYIDINRQHNLAKSQEPFKRELSREYIQLLRDFVIFALRVVNALPRIKMVGGWEERFEHEENYLIRQINKGVANWGTYWRNETQKAIIELNEYIAELEIYRPQIGEIPNWPRRISPEFMWRKKLLRYLNQ